MKHHFLMQGVELVVLGEETLKKAQKRVTGCVACSASASRSFESLLYLMFAPNDGMTEYFLGVPTECPKCGASIFEKTPVDCDGKAKAALEEEYRAFDIRDEDQEVIFIDEVTLADAQGFIDACEHCSDEAEMPFDQLLDAITGCDPSLTEYVICHAAKCRSCGHDVMEKTLIVPR